MHPKDPTGEDPGYPVTQVAMSDSGARPRLNRLMDAPQSGYPKAMPTASHLFSIAGRISLNTEG